MGPFIMNHQPWWVDMKMDLRFWWINYKNGLVIRWTRRLTGRRVGCTGCHNWQQIFQMVDPAYPRRWWRKAGYRRMLRNSEAMLDLVGESNH